MVRGRNHDRLHFRKIQKPPIVRKCLDVIFCRDTFGPRLINVGHSNNPPRSRQTTQQPTPLPSHSDKTHTDPVIRPRLDSISQHPRGKNIGRVIAEASPAAFRRNFAWTTEGDELFFIFTVPLEHLDLNNLNTFPLVDKVSLSPV